MSATKRPARFGRTHASELEWYHREAAGDLGLSSSLGPMINLALSGIQDGGRVNHQHTRASFDASSVVARQRRVSEALGSLDERHQIVLSARYGDHRPVARKGDSPKEAGEYAAMLSPSERLFAELAHVVTRALDVDCARLLGELGLRPPKKPPKADAAAAAEVAEAARLVAARIARAKADVARAKRDADELVRGAQQAFADAWRALPPQRARRSLTAYRAWLDGGDS